LKSNNAKMLVNEELNHIQTCYDCMKRHVYFALPTLSCVSSTHVHDHFLLDAHVDETLLRVYCHYSLLRARKSACLFENCSFDRLTALGSIAFYLWNCIFFTILFKIWCYILYTECVNSTQTCLNL
jgi:hypothetical protein